ncbi:MAG: hypothetical protein WC655_17190 [Candidatus Hydrogenedentales bacterium]|jgi:hypothetical protein
MNAIVNFFKSFGHRMGQALGFISSHITDAQLQVAIGFVTQAEDKFLDNPGRRNWVVGELQKIPGVNENIARLLTEMAVGMVKKELHKITEEAVAAILHPAN